MSQANFVWKLGRAGIGTSGLVFQCLASYTLQSWSNRLGAWSLLYSPTHRPLVGTFNYRSSIYCVQASVSVVRNSEVVRYSGAAIVLGYRVSDQLSAATYIRTII